MAMLADLLEEEEMANSLPEAACALPMRVITMSQSASARISPAM